MNIFGFEDCLLWVMFGEDLWSFLWFLHLVGLMIFGVVFVGFGDVFGNFW